MNLIDFSLLSITSHMAVTRKDKLKTKQKGAALVVALIMLVLMTLVGVTAIQVTTVQEKMVANSRDLNVAFQAAEAGLLKGKDYVKSKDMVQLDADFSADCKKNRGLCKRHISVPIWTTIDWQITDPTKSSTLEASFYLQSVAKNPRYIIEDVTSMAEASGDDLKAGLTTGLYRITAQGYGQAVDDSGQPLARVMLQGVFKK